jgi:serine/threonine protein kinase
MLGDRWSRIEEIFHAALECPLPERDAYLVRACGDDRTLRSEVESLLAHDSDGGTTIDLLVGNDLKDLARASSQSDSGLQIGPYRLVRELDSGGMGVVHLAVRSDDHYFQVVAIKTIRKGLASPDLVQRFRAERQILAALTHPNIGAILDGGNTDDGRPYIVMEYVEGQPITIAAENRNLSVRQRIELFRSVCSAVHYAHQKLVIHRDIKPSNVLVTPEGIVKLIDFGVSKPLAPELIPGRLPKTESWQRFMTPDYASPEQIQGRELTTATDVYSLGVLLFELLTNSRPYTVHDLSPAAAERLVCEQETPKPSSFKGLSDRAEKELEGDLDRIVLMAMEKDPSRRYLSASHLEEDLSRFLEAKPVLASKATILYRLRKFLQRHQTTSWMALATSVVLAGTILFYSWQSRLADRRIKETEKLADSAISDISEKLQQSSVPVETQAALFRSALQYLDQLRKSSGNEPRLLLKLSRAYARVGDLEGSPYVANLGNSGVALTSYQEALRMALAAHSRLPGGENTQGLIEAYERLGALEFFLGKIEEAHDKYQRSLSLAHDFWKDKPEDPTRKRLLAMSYARLGDLQLDDLETDTALESFRAAFLIFGTEPNGDEDHDVTLMRLHVRMGGALMEHGSPQEALANRRKALAISEALAQKSPSSNQAQQNLFEAYNFMNAPLVGIETLSVGDSTQAEIYARKALDIVEGMVGRDHSNIWARSHLAYGYGLMGDALRVTRPAAASEWYRKALLVTKEVAPSYPVGSYPEDWIAEGDENLAASLRGSEVALEKVHLLEDANSVWQQLVHASPGKPQYRMSLMRSDCKLSDSELAINNLNKARQYADSAVRFFDDFKITSQSLLVLRDLGFCYESLGNVQRQISMNSSFSAARRHAAHTQAQHWFQKSAEVWSEWKRRDASTPESEIERHKVERLLRQVKSSDHRETLSSTFSKGQRLLPRLN